ncbi:MAG: SufD family Fe-S cluster assembly protein [Hyphomonadaceae bacterium]
MSALRDLLPTRRVESWKYSDLRAALADTALPPAPTELRAASIIAQLAPGATETRRIDEDELLIERFDETGLDARADEYVVAPGRRLTRVLLQTGPDTPLSYISVRLGAGAAFEQFVLAEGARLARIETHVIVEGDNAEVTLNGVYLAGSGRHADLTSTIAHRAPGGVTRQTVKGVARKRGRGVFQGRILVERAAQKTDARQHHQALLLEEGAEVFAKPELMIHADDVACAHGNTVGALDESALFYLRARGVPEGAARALLVEAFLVQAIPDFVGGDLRAEIERRIRNWLEAGP